MDSQEKPRRVGRSYKGGEGSSKQGHHQQEEVTLSAVRSFVDDSVQFVDEELRRLGLDPNILAEARSRLEYGLISSWAAWVLDLFDYLPTEDSLVREEDKTCFLNERFGLGLKESSSPFELLFGP